MSKLMEYRGYHATVEYDNEDELFIGKVFGISDSLNFHGTSVTELKTMFHQSIDNYLEMCERFGKEPDREFKGSFNVRIPPSLHRNISLEATKNGITLNQLIIQALTEYLRNSVHKELVFYQDAVTKQFKLCESSSAYNVQANYVESTSRSIERRATYAYS